MDGTSLAIWIVTGAGSFLGAPLLLYFNSIFQSKKDQRYIQVRRPPIISKIIYLSAIHLLFERPFLAAYSTSILPEWNSITILYLILPCMPIIGFLYFLRVWTFYFDVKMKLENSLFLQDVHNNSEESNVDNGGSILYSAVGRNTQLNVSNHIQKHSENCFTVAILAVPAGLYVILHLCANIFWGFNLRMHDIINLISVIMPVLLSLILLYQIEDSADPFHLKLELDVCCGCTLTCVFIGLVLSQAVKDHETFQLCHFIFIILGTMTLSIIQTFGVIFTHSRMENSFAHILQTDLEKELCKILNNQQGFQSFEAYLTHEFSNVNLNFFAEVCKYKDLISEVVGGETDLTICDKVQLPWVTTPDSFNSFFCKMYAMHLHEKYVQPGCHSQVNLPSYILKKIEKNMRDFKSDDLPDIFDDAQSEIWQLMQDSFRRFENTKEYQDLEIDDMIYNNNNSSNLSLFGYSKGNSKAGPKRSSFKKNTSKILMKLPTKEWSSVGL